MDDLDSTQRIYLIRKTIATKTSLRLLYKESYEKYRRCIEACHVEGHVLELGSGGGFAKDLISSIITSDILPYPGIDLVTDGTSLPFADSSLKVICMLNVLHHLPDAEAFFNEAYRTLVKNGRILIIDQHNGLISRFIFKHLHHEDFSPHSQNWRFSVKRPLSHANGALAWIIFVRDRIKFERLFPGLKVLRYEQHTPLRYWLSGGLRWWNLLPARGLQLATSFDNFLLKLSPDLGSFVDIELEKI